MTVGVGGQTVIGTATETVYGTGVTVDRFLPFVSESLDTRTRVLTDESIRGANTGVHLPRGSRRRLTGEDGGGDITMTLTTTALGRFFNQLMGGTATVAQQGGTVAYLQTHAWASQAGKSMTIQKQIRDAANAEVESFTFNGAKVLSAGFSQSLDRIAQVVWGIDARQVLTSVAMATPTWPAVEKTFGFPDCTVKLAGASSTVLSDVSVSIARGLDTDKRFLGNAGLKNEPYDNAPPTISGSVTADFDSPATIYDRFKADTPLSFELIWERDTIAGAYKEKLSVLVPEVRFTGETPKVGSPEVVTVSGSFEGYWDGSASDVTVSYTSSDTAI